MGIRVRVIDAAAIAMPLVLTTTRCAPEKQAAVVQAIAVDSQPIQAAAFSVREIGRDFLLGVQRDADDVEQVRLLRLRRRAREAS